MHPMFAVAPTTFVERFWVMAIGGGSGILFIVYKDEGEKETQWTAEYRLVASEKSLLEFERSLGVKIRNAGRASFTNKDEAIAHVQHFVDFGVNTAEGRLLVDMTIQGSATDLVERINKETDLGAKMIEVPASMLGTDAFSRISPVPPPAPGKKETIH